jgi:UDP:flavonoid glycosyltransferase YjiC (YdhE family)
VRVLFTTRPLAGHVLPTLPLARALEAAGHEVALASAGAALEHARRAGLRCFEAGLSDAAARGELRRRSARLAELPPHEVRRLFFAEGFGRLELEARLPELERIVGEWRPALVVHDLAELAGPLAAAAAGIPWVDHSYGPAVPRDLLEAGTEAAAPQWRARGLEPRVLGGSLYVDICPPALQLPGEPRAPRVQPLRPAEPRRHDPAAWPRSFPDRPAVYVSLGTVWNRQPDVFRTVLEGLARFELELLVTVGPDNDPELLGPQPPHVHVEQFVPQAQVLPAMDLVVTHGGAGTMLGSFACGLPLLVLPQGADQYANAEAVVAAGAGLALTPAELSADAVASGVGALLDDACYREAARGIRSEIAAMPSPAGAVPVLEALTASIRGGPSEGAWT